MQKDSCKIRDHTKTPKRQKSAFGQQETAFLQKFAKDFLEN